MRFEDPKDGDKVAEQGTTRTEFHKIDTDIQLAIEELDHTLSNNQAQLIIKSCKNGVLRMEIWIDG